MDDLISRQSAIDALYELVEARREWITDARGEIAGLDAAICTIDDLPSRTQRWIPVTERLPKPYEYCLWTTTDGRVVYHHCDGLFSNYTAWMPLPKPYKESDL